MSEATLQDEAVRRDLHNVVIGRSLYSVVATSRESALEWARSYAKTQESAEWRGKD